MKKVLSLFLILSMLSVFHTDKAKAQTIEILAGNTFNGAMNGTILGGAVMALNNSNEFDPLRIGLGLGVLGGMGVGVYDITYGRGNEILVSGLFNDGNNTSIIILLDTFYGVAAGSVILTSVMLVANEPLLDGLQYGAGVGAIAGFGFGIIDSFLLAERISAGSSPVPSSSSNAANGLVGIHLDQSKSLGLLSPSLTKTYELSSQNLSMKYTPTLDVVNFRINF